jgi:hypothetical protein
MYGATAISEPWSPSKGASSFVYPQFVSNILIFLGSLVHASGQNPSTLFLVVQLILCCGISH